MVKRSCSRTYLRAFTLLEVVLAISLSTVLLLILTTAIHLFLFRTEANRGDVETNQLARALLNRLADDLRAAHFSKASTGQSAMGQASTGSQEASTRASAGTGIVGTPTEVRIDQTARWRWESVPEAEPVDTRQSPADQTRTAPTSASPETVRYFLREGDQLSAADLAQRGSQEIPDDSIAGLCFERWKTAQTQMGPTPMAQSPTDSTHASASAESGPSPYVELLAPEVIELEFAYADDTGELVDQWNSAEQGALPRAVEIQLTLRKELPQGSRDARPASQPASRADGTRRHAARDTMKYRLLVELPDVQSPRPLEVYSSKSSSNSSASTSSDSANSTNSANSEGDTPRSSGADRQR